MIFVKIGFEFVFILLFIDQQQSRKCYKSQLYREENLYKSATYKAENVTTSTHVQDRESYNSYICYSQLWQLQKLYSQGGKYYKSLSQYRKCYNSQSYLKILDSVFHFKNLFCLTLQVKP